MLIVARWSRFISLLFLFLAASASPAQEVDAGEWQSGLIALNEGWLQHKGDDLGWAQPKFDDSSWQKVELDELGAAEPGWNWYRIHVKLAPEHEPVDLLIAGGQGTYELYINGVRQKGADIRPYWGERRPTEQIFMPPNADKDLTIAIRTHATVMYTIWHLPLFLKASIGTIGPIENERAVLESQRLYTVVPSIAINLVIILAGIGAFALFQNQPGHREYLWLGLFLTQLGISNGLLYSADAGLMMLVWNNWLADPLIYVYTLMQIEFTFSFAGKPVSRAWRVYEALILADLFSNPLVTLGIVPGNLYISIEGLVIFPAALLLPILLAMWLKKGNREAGLLIVPSLMPAASTALFSIGSASIFTGWGKLDFLANPISVGPISLQISDIADFFFVLAIGVVMFFRYTRVSREQARIASELDAAQRVQGLLLSSNPGGSSTILIETVYRPAQEVGGDFFHIADLDGLTRIVVGDVSGKGLGAAMLVSAIVGALDTTRETTPAGVLHSLNHLMLARQQSGFATCLCAAVSPLGQVILANAGHLAPYHNKEELPLDSSLPLGIVPTAEFGQVTFHLAPGDYVTFLSDGVVEAQNKQGELFGFDRAREISTLTASEIASRAQIFGQEDDITVLTLSFAPAEVSL